VTTTITAGYLVSEYVLTAADCSWTYEWTIGDDTGQQFVTSTGGTEDVDYATGTLTGTVRDNIEDSFSGVLFNDGLIVRILRSGDVYLSSDNAMTSHEDSFTFDIAYDGLIREFGGFACLVSNPANCEAIVGDQTLIQFQDVIVNGTLYEDAMLLWELESEPYTTVSLPGRFGITPPSSVDTGGRALHDVTITAPGVWEIALIQIVVSDGTVDAAFELQAAPTCN